MGQVMRMLMAVTLALTGASVAASDAGKEPLRLAYIDALSGPFGSVGDNALRQFEHAVDVIVDSQGGILGGRTIEIVPFDSRGSAISSQRRLRQAYDQGIRIVLQGNSSHVATELTQAIERRNQRHPEDPILYLNFSAVDPALTNELCNFWHFRFDPHAEMKVAALTELIRKREDINKLYIIGQDYSHGHAVAESAKSQLRKTRPDMEIVTEFHSVGMIDDFSPHVERIKAANPDAILTGNWGDDILRLGKAINEAGLSVPVYTFYGGFDGTTAAFGAAGNGRIHLVHGGQFNPAPTDKIEQVNREFKEKYPDRDLNSFRIINTIDFLARAIEEAGTTSTYEIAKALEGMEFTSLGGHKIRMRRRDHQVIEPLNVSVQTGEDIQFDVDNSGFGFKTVETIDAEVIESVPTSCRMERPAQGSVGVTAG